MKKFNFFYKIIILPLFISTVFITLLSFIGKSIGIKYKFTDSYADSVEVKQEKAPYVLFDTGEKIIKDEKGYIISLIEVNKEGYFIFRISESLGKKYLKKYKDKNKILEIIFTEDPTVEFDKKNNALRFKIKEGYLEIEASNKKLAQKLYKDYVNYKLAKKISKYVYPVAEKCVLDIVKYCAMNPTKKIDYDVFFSCKNRNEGKEKIIINGYPKTVICDQYNIVKENFKVIVSLERKKNYYTICIISKGGGINCKLEKGNSNVNLLKIK